MIKLLLFVCGLFVMNQSLNANSKYCFRIINNQPIFYDCELQYDYKKD